MKPMDRLGHFSRECFDLRRAIQDGSLSSTDDILLAKAHILAVMNDLMTMLAHTPRGKGTKGKARTSTI